jgi:hypothetical protein
LEAIRLRKPFTGFGWIFAPTTVLTMLVGIGFISLIIVNFIVGIVRIFKPEFCEPSRVIEIKEEVDNRATKRLAIDYLMAERIKSRREVGLGDSGKFCKTASPMAPSVKLSI